MTVRNGLFDHAQQKRLTAWHVYLNIGGSSEKNNQIQLLQKCPDGSLADLSVVLYVSYSLTEIQLCRNAHVFLT